MEFEILSNEISKFIINIWNLGRFFDKLLAYICKMS